MNPHTHCFGDLGAQRIEGIVYVKENNELIICDWPLKNERTLSRLYSPWVCSMVIMLEL